MTESYEILNPDNSYLRLNEYLAQNKPNLILTDTNVLPITQRFQENINSLKDVPVCVIPAGDINKNVDSWQTVLGMLSDLKVSRNGILLNIGGGMISDLGGFSAACFKRGIEYINICTTLLGAVDACFGGKTAINFRNVKNEVGAFHSPKHVFVSLSDFATLKKEEFLSGYGEVLKTTALIAKDDFISAWNPGKYISQPTLLKSLVEKCYRFKDGVVTRDKFETGDRKYLNLGHTFGHALESMMMHQKGFMPHGYAVAHGILLSLILSHLLCNLDSSIAYAYAKELVRPFYGFSGISCDDYSSLLEYMHHDKKNDTDAITFVLLKEIGDPIIMKVADEKIKIAMDIYRDLID